MKKHLLLGSALLAAISAFPQNASVVAPRSARAVNMADKIARKFALNNYNENAPAGPQNSSSGHQSFLQEGTAERSSQSSVFFNSLNLTTNWTKFTGSMNIYGMLVSSSRPLQYHDDLNAVTYVHRKSNTYAPTPTPATTGAATGAVVTMVSTNMGATWDSTCVWNDDNNWARYPQGGILSGAGNTSIANATIIVTAPITQANTNLGWIGSGFGAKKLGPGTYNSTAASQTFVANSSPYAGLGRKVDFPRLDFTTTDNGYVYALGQIFDGTVNGTTAAAQAFRGSRLIRGEFASGAVVFTHDSIIPDVRVSSVTGNLVSSSPGMAWSENGQIGYVYHFGSVGSSVPSHSSGVNSGFQPIVWKTTDFGGSWAPISPIDFSQPAFQTAVVDHVPGTSADPNMTIPFFNLSEGISAVVDRNGKLHLVSLINASFSPDPDSSAFTTNFGNYDGERYNYLHVPGARPYLYDFTTDGTPNGWTVTVIDSLGSEGPGTRSTDDGYALNPWDATGGTGSDKVEVDARVQVTRTADGANIIYTWSETDSLITPAGNKKWNIAPNIHARLMRVGANGTQTLSPTEHIVTRLAGTSGGLNPNISNRGFNFYVASRAAVNATATVCDTMSFYLPFTVSNSPAQLEQLNPVNTWYANANLAFIAAGAATCATTGTLDVGVADHNIASTSVLYPNPAKTNAVLAVDLRNTSKMEITVMNLVGQSVKSVKAEGQVGNNTVNIDLNGLSKGVYMVNVKIDNAVSTKKLIIE